MRQKQEQSRGQKKRERRQERDNRKKWLRKIKKRWVSVEKAIRNTEQLGRDGEGKGEQLALLWLFLARFPNNWWINFAFNFTQWLIIKLTASLPHCVAQPQPDMTHLCRHSKAICLSLSLCYLLTYQLVSMPATLWVFGFDSSFSVRLSKSSFAGASF